MPSKTPTLENATLKQLVDLDACRTASSTELSVKDALAAKVPFVVTFATPTYCQSRTCGPIVDVVSAVRKREAGSNVRFIHVEVYKDNDPAKGVNQWMREWHLPTEPWVFVVGRRQDRESGSRARSPVSELDAAVNRPDHGSGAAPGRAIICGLEPDGAPDHDLAATRARRAEAEADIADDLGAVLRAGSSPPPASPADVGHRRVDEARADRDARTPSSSRSAFSEWVSEITAAFVAP